MNYHLQHSRKPLHIYIYAVKCVKLLGGSDVRNMGHVSSDPTDEFVTRKWQWKLLRPKLVEIQLIELQESHYLKKEKKVLTASTQLSNCKFTRRDHKQKSSKTDSTDINFY